MERTRRVRLHKFTCMTSGTCQPRSCIETTRSPLDFKATITVDEDTTTRMNTNSLRPCNGGSNLNAEVTIHERREVALLVFPSLLTPTLLQLQSALNSPSIKAGELILESEQLRVRGLLQDIKSELETIDAQIRQSEE